MSKKKDELNFNVIIVVAVLVAILLLLLGHSSESIFISYFGIIFSGLLVKIYNKL